MITLTVRLDTTHTSFTESEIVDVLLNSDTKLGSVVISGRPFNAEITGITITKEGDRDNE